jgi:hypothetical protein
MRRIALVVIALLVVGCTGGGDGDDDAAPTTTEAPTTTVIEMTTTTAAPDPFTVPADPADIDEAYVAAVLTELERINGDALRLAVSEGLSPTITEMITSANDADQASHELDTLVNASLDDFSGMNRPPGDVVLAVVELLVANTSCIAVDVTEDYTPIGPAGVSGVPTRIELRRSPESNRTEWIYSLRHPLDGQTSPPQVCAASS